MRCSVLSSSSSFTLQPWPRPGAVVVMSRRVGLLGREVLDVGVLFSCFCWVFVVSDRQCREKVKNLNCLLHFDLLSDRRCCRPESSIRLLHVSRRRGSQLLCVFVSSELELARGCSSARVVMVIKWVTAAARFALWLSSGRCVCDIEPQWPPSL